MLRGIRRAPRGLAVALFVACIAVTYPAAPAHAQDAELAQTLARADAAYARGDYGRAANLLDKAISSSARDITAAAFAKRASIFLLRDRPGEGVRWIERVAEPIHPDDAGIRAQKALLLARIPGRRLDAVVLADAVLRGHPRQAALQLLVGDYYLRRGNAPKRAVEAYRAFLRVRSDQQSGFDKQVRDKLGFALLLANRPAEAERAFTAALADGGDPRLDMLARRGLCAAAAERAQWKRARARCDRAERDAGKRPDAATMRHLVRANLGLERTGDAFNVAMRLATRHPHRASSHVLLGDVLAQRGDWDRAEARYRRAIVLAPEHASALRRLGEIDLERDPPRNERALERLQLAARAHPGDLATLHQLARAQLANQLYSETSATATRALGLKPGPTVAGKLHLVRGSARSAGGALREAAADGEEAMRLWPSSVSRAFLLDALNDLAASQATKKPSEARATLRRAIGIDRSHQRSARNLAALAIALGDSNAALDALGGVSNATAPALVRLRARAQRDAGRTEQAINSYRRALSAAKESPSLQREVLIELGELLAPADEGVSLLERAVRLGVGDATRRHARQSLARARCARGLKRLASGDARRAAADLDAADGQLEGEEHSACRFVRALAHLEAGKTGSAVKILSDVKAGSGLLGSDPAGRALLMAYVDYRVGTSAALKKAARAVRPLMKPGSSVRTEARSLLSAIYALTAYRQGVAGRTKAAMVSLRQARTYASAQQRDPIEHNQLALRMRKGAVKGLDASLRKLGSSPVEALINRGILAESKGDHAAAMARWRAAVSRGSKNNSVKRWIRIKEQLRGL